MTNLLCVQNDSTYFEDLELSPNNHKDTHDQSVVLEKTLMFGGSTTHPRKVTILSILTLVTRVICWIAFRNKTKKKVTTIQIVSIQFAL